jgi:protein-disulfide isomerase
LRYFAPNKRKLTLSVIGIALVCLLGVSSNGLAQPRPPATFPNWAMGRADAPVTLIEYGSLTCSHCAEFNRDVMPTIKRLYIDTGRVRYILRPLPTPPFELSIAMHALTLCAGPSRYYPLVEAFFDRQQDVFNAARGETGPKGAIFAIAEDVGGLNYATSEACLRDPARQNQVRASADMGDAAGVQGTPTLFVNGVLVAIQPGKAHLEVIDLTRAIDAALRMQAPRRPTPSKAKKR